MSIANILFGFGSKTESRNLFLLLSLVGVVILIPTVGRIAWLFDVSLAIALLACIRSVSFTRQTSRIAWGLGFLPLVSLFLGDLLPPIANNAARLLTMPFFAYTVVVLVAQLMRARTVDAGELFAAASTYLLIGLTWGVVFVITEEIMPGSFSFPGHDPGGPESLIYFSVITMVTVGYGEITPVTDFARTCAMTEALMGSLYLTILVARLVGIYTSGQMEQRDQEPRG